MSHEADNTHGQTPATEPVGSPVERGVGPHATDGAAPLWFDDGGRAWWGAEELTGDHIAAWAEAKVAAERVRIAAVIRAAWHDREASHGNRAGEYHEGMLAGLDAAVALALGPNP